MDTTQPTVLPTLRELQKIAASTKVDFTSEEQALVKAWGLIPEEQWSAVPVAEESSSRCKSFLFLMQKFLIQG